MKFLHIKIGKFWIVRTNSDGEMAETKVIFQIKIIYSLKFYFKFAYLKFKILKRTQMKKLLVPKL